MTAVLGVEPAGTRLAAVSSLPARFLLHVQPALPPANAPEMGECLLWTASTRGAGYGQFARRAAHIVAWEHVHGPVPAGLVVDHRCHNLDLTCPGGEDCWHRRCVNVEHLEPVPQYVNVYRGRSLMARRAAATVCENGHLLAGRNLYLRKDRVRGDGQPRRECRTCRNRRAA